MKRGARTHACRVEIHLDAWVCTPRQVMRSRTAIESRLVQSQGDGNCVRMARCRTSGRRYLGLLGEKQSTEMKGLDLRQALPILFPVVVILLRSGKTYR